MKFLLLTLVSGLCAAVQQERKPSDQKEKMAATVATSTQRIYIRKDFNSPSAAIPTFAGRVIILYVHSLNILAH